MRMRRRRSGEHRRSVISQILFETIAIVWFYGTKRLSENIEEMTGKKPNIVFRICWMFISPVLILVIWVFTLYDYQAPSYNNGAYEYPADVRRRASSVTATL